jgi:hypothetical protein
LTHLRDLIKAGAAVLGDPPQRTPGLTDYPVADHALQELVAEIWGTDPSVTARTLGQGRVFRGIAPEMALAALGVAPDFVNGAGIKFLHRRVDGAEVYFLSHAGADAIVANCTFRVTGRQPERWDPVTGRITQLQAYATTAGATTLSIPFEPNGSAFIVFARPDPAPADRLMNVVLDGVTVMEHGVYFPLQPGSEPVIDLVSGDLRERGAYVLTTADGRSRQFVVDPPPDTVAVTGGSSSFPPAGVRPPQSRWIV